MSNSNDVIKCNNCGKYFLDNSNIVCPFCKKSLNELPDVFGDIFGNQNNPFQDFTNQGESDNEAY